MRNLRWKPQYLTGDAAVDARNRALFEIVSGAAERMRTKEHCQDMNDLCDDLVSLVGQGFAAVAADASAAPEADAALGDLTAERLPLPAKGTAACRDCGICDWLGQALGAWLPAAGTTEIGEM